MGKFNLQLTQLSILMLLLVWLMVLIISTMWANRCVANVREYLHLFQLIAKDASKHCADGKIEEKLQRPDEVFPLPHQEPWNTLRNP